MHVFVYVIIRIHANVHTISLADSIKMIMMIIIFVIKKDSKTAVGIKRENERERDSNP
jgi:hypothetical protein